MQGNNFYYNNINKIMDKKIFIYVSLIYYNANK